MRYSQSLLPFVGSLASLASAKPLSQPSLSFKPLPPVSPDSAHNIHVEYYGDVNGELKITHGSCDSIPSIASASQSIGTTHVGEHPLAKRHADHDDQRPTKFVWVTPSEMSQGCLHAFLDGDHIGSSEELVVTKRLTRRHEKRSFVDVAGDDSQWFDGIAYLKQKQPSEAFVSSVKSKSFGILGAGISGLMTSVSSYHPTLIAATKLICDITVVARLCRYSQLEDPRVIRACWWPHQDSLP